MANIQPSESICIFINGKLYWSWKRGMWGDKRQSERRPRKRKGKK